jgi:hypothetical protein
VNSQLNPTSPLDARIDWVLDALRTTEPPAGLEQRIAARLAQAAETRNLPTSPSAAAPSFFAVVLSAVKDPRILLAPANLYIAAGTALTVVLALAALMIVHPRPATNTAQTDFRAHSNPLPQALTAPSTPTAQDRTAASVLEDAALHSPHHSLIPTTALPASVISPQPSPSAQDLDQLALAETLAPSHPAPPLPLTAQEHLMLAATRPGQPIQLAELDISRSSSLRAEAKAREEASIGRYVKRLLFPFAVADALSPTTDSQPQEASTPATPPSK